MRVEQIAHLLRRRAGERRGLALELAQLLQRERDRAAEALELGGDGAGSMRYSGTAMLLSSLTKAGPMAIPGEIASPCSTRSSFSASCSLLSSNPPEMSAASAVDARARHRARGAQLDLGAGTGGQHHQAHDRAARDRRAVLGDRDLGVEFEGELDEARGGAGVQAALVADGDGAPRRLRLGSRAPRPSADVGEELRGDVDVFAARLLRAAHGVGQASRSGAGSRA